MPKVLLISVGEIIGANLRYFVAQYVAKPMHSSFPYGTLIISVSASIILGFLLIWISERVVAVARWQMLVAVGFCATYSTYSGFGCARCGIGLNFIGGGFDSWTPPSKSRCT